MIRRAGVWIALGIVALVVFALASFPAATAYHYLRPDGLRLMGVSGTVWSGHAALGAVHGTPLHDIHWRLHGASILTGRLKGHLSAKLDDGFVEADATAYPNGTLVLRDVKAAANLAAFADRSAVPGLRGQASIALSQVVLIQLWPTRAAGTIRVAMLAVPPLLGKQQDAGLIPLGSYEMDFKPRAVPGIAATFRDTGGPLKVQGSFTLDPQRRYDIQGLVTARDTASPDLRQALQFLPQEKGGRRISLRGAF